MSKVYTGIWIDSREALIFQMTRTSEHFKRLNSGVETHHLHNGGRSSIPNVPHDANKEKELLRKRNSQLKIYFESILNHIATSDEVLLCGPGNTKLALEKMILKARHVEVQILGDQHGTRSALDKKPILTMLNAALGCIEHPTVDQFAGETIVPDRE